MDFATAVISGGLQGISFRRDADTNTRDARATRKRGSRASGNKNIRIRIGGRTIEKGRLPPVVSSLFSIKAAHWHDGIRGTELGARGQGAKRREGRGEVTISKGAWHKRLYNAKRSGKRLGLGTA